MTRAQRIRTAMEEQFAPERVELTDDSSRHAGHLGHDSAGETHFRLTVVSAKFEGVRQVDRQRQIYARLAAEFRNGLHALDLCALTPAEAQSFSSG